MYDKFNHYLYEIKRSDLKPVMEAACIWTHLDQRSKTFKKLDYDYSNDQRRVKPRNHICQVSDMKNYNFAFICSLCGQFYSSHFGLISSKKCIGCNSYFECSSCVEKMMSSDQIKSLLSLFKGDMAFFKSQFEYWKPMEKQVLPDFVILVPKGNSKMSYIFCQKFTLKENIFYVQVIEANQQLESKIVITLSVEFKKGAEELIEKFFVLEWMEKRHVNRTVKNES